MPRKVLNIPKAEQRKLGLYHPQWKGSAFEEWTNKFINNNHWRVVHLFSDREDAYQECAVVFAICKDRYRYKVDNPAWFMSLYKIAVINKWNKLSRKDEKHRELIDSTAVLTNEYDDGASDEATAPGIQPAEPPTAPFVVAINELGPELRLVLDRLINAPAEFITSLFELPKVPPGVPLPSQYLRIKWINYYLHQLYQIPYNGKQPHNIIERLRDLAGSV